MWRGLRDYGIIGKIMEIISSDGWCAAIGNKCIWKCLEDCIEASITLQYNN